MRFQLLSNIWNKIPKGIQTKAPVLVLNGNIGRLDATTFSMVKELVGQYDQVYWVPYAAETFRPCGRALDSLIVRELIGQTGAVCLSNDVAALGDTTLVGTSGWWPGRGGAPQTLDAWRSEDADFINENCYVGSTLIVAGCHYNRKPTTIIGGIVPEGMENLKLLAGRQQVITNDAQAPKFDCNAVFEC
jgi:hypothetical protein